MKRRIFALLAAAACALGLVACKKPIENNDGFTYAEIKTDGEVTAYEVTGLNEIQPAELIIPSSYNNKPVTQISEKAFYECLFVTAVIIPDTVRGIGKNAFAECTSITSVTLGEGLTEIGESAFYDCQGLKELTIPDSVETVGELSFAECVSLESVTFGKGVTLIDEYAFFECYAITELTIPSNVKTIGECAFTSCTSLKSVKLNDGLESIGECAFGGCFSLEGLTMPDSVTSIGWGVLKFESFAGFVTGDSFNSLTQIVMSNSIIEIPDFAFSFCNIKSINIGNKVENIGYSAFYGCAMLESVVISESVKKITSYAFYRCPLLQTVYYTGNEAGWKKITIGRNGNDISNATVYYYSETRPSQAGNFWRYADGEITKW